MYVVPYQLFGYILGTLADWVMDRSERKIQGDIEAKLAYTEIELYLCYLSCCESLRLLSSSFPSLSASWIITFIVEHQSHSRDYSGWYVSSLFITASPWSLKTCFSSQGQYNTRNPQKRGYAVSGRLHIIDNVYHISHVCTSAHISLYMIQFNSHFRY